MTCVYSSRETPTYPCLLEKNWNHQKFFVPSPFHIDIDIMFNLLIPFRPYSNRILCENTNTLLITTVLINEQLYLNFGYYSMGFCGIGYYVSLGIRALSIMSHCVFWQWVL